MKRSQFVPEGFRLVAVTEGPGLGSVMVKAYFNGRTNEVYMEVHAFTTGEFAVTPCVAPVGPFPKTMIEPMQITLNDVNDMKAPSYLTEEDADVA